MKWQVTQKYASVAILVHASVVRVILVFISLSEAFTLKILLIFLLHQLSEVEPGGKCVSWVERVDHLMKALILCNRKRSHILYDHVQNAIGKSGGHVGRANSYVLFMEEILHAALILPEK